MAHKVDWRRDSDYYSQAVKRRVASKFDVRHSKSRMLACHYRVVVLTGTGAMHYYFLL